MKGKRKMNLLLARKLQNQVSRICPDFEFKLKNIIVNGQKRGCSGFIRNPKNGLIFYVDTETVSYGGFFQDKILLRYASSMSNYCGERNQWIEQNRVCQAIVNLLIKKCY